MASADLEAGRLTALSQISVRLGQPYCAFMLPAKAERADIAGLVELLAMRPGP
jgi:LysR family glycine cleavage system transcriptional activator